MITATDEDGDSSFIGFDLTVEKVPPIPSIDVITLPRLEGRQIDVTASATDPAGGHDTLTFDYEVFKDRSLFASDFGVERTSFSFSPKPSTMYLPRLRGER